MSPTPGFRITTLHAFVTIGDDDEEGVVGVQTAEGWVPLVAADAARIEALRPLASMVAGASGRPVQMARFTVREDLEVFEP